MNRVATASPEKRGLMKKVYDPTQSKIARQGRAGGNGFEGVYIRQDPRYSNRPRWVIGESKYSQSQLGEFTVTVYDTRGNLVQ
jgi:hypothetical protein